LVAALTAAVISGHAKHRSVNFHHRQVFAGRPYASAMQADRVNGG
jgi:hypothetical protein